MFLSRVALCALLLVLTAGRSLFGIGTPAGTVVQLVVHGTYSGIDNVARSCEPAAHVLTVGHVRGVAINAVSSSGQVPPGTTGYFAMAVGNVGNAPDDFTLEVRSEQWNTRIIRDDDGDGVRDPSENSTITAAHGIPEDGSLPCFAEVVVPRGGPTQGSISVTATSSSDSSATDTISLTVTASTHDPIIVLVTSPTSDPEFGRNWNVLTIGGTVSGGIGDADVTWANHTTGQSGRCTVTGSSWTAPAIDLLPGANEVVVTAVDAHGNAGAAELRVTYLDCSPGAAWHGRLMVSIPIIPDQTDPKELVGFDRANWSVFDSAAGVYYAYPHQRTFLRPAEATPGRGFWATFSGQGTRPVGTIPPQDRPVTVHLKRGWNIVGQPFINPIDWSLSAIKVKGPGQSPKPLGESGSLVSCFAWGWQQNPTNPFTGWCYLISDPSIVSGAATRLEPWMAYWVLAFEECDLILPPP